MLIKCIVPIKKLTVGVLLVLGLAIQLCINTVLAQEAFTRPSAKLLTRFPFVQLTGGVVLIKGTIDNNSDSLNFILDTGSGGISLDSALVAKLGFKVVPSDRTVRGIAGMKQVSFTNKHNLYLPGLHLDSLNFHINDYDLLTSVYGIHIDGIIGFTFLRRYIVAIDYDNMVISVYQPGAFKYPRGGYLLEPNFTSLPLISGAITDYRHINEKFIFDTGAGLCLLLSEEFVSDSILFGKKRKRYPSQAEGLGGKKQTDITFVKQVQIGPYKFRKVPAFIFSDDYNVTSYPLLGGLIGNDLWRRFNIILNYPDQVFHIKPNTHFNDFFDYSYTGLGIYQYGDIVKVEDVVKGSPGDKAGFLPGDIIFSLDNAISKNIQVFKSILQTPGTKIKVVIIRNGKPIELKLTVKNILR